MVDWIKESEKYKEEILKIRRQIHSNPEIGNQEFETQKLICEFLTKEGIPFETVLDTGVIATIKGKDSDRVVGLRADIDALPIQEATGCEFASKNNGVMHACGHDVHISAALLAAKLINEHKDTLEGTVKVIFQPDEEDKGGALRIIATGKVDDVEAYFGCHVSPDLPADSVGYKYGKFYAAADKFVIEVHGKSAHGATPEKGVDAIQAAAQIATMLKAIPAQFEDRCVVTPSMFHGGNVINIVCDYVSISGLLRTLGQKNRQEVKDMIKSVCVKTEEDFGVKVDVTFVESYMGIVNTDKETDLVKACAEKLFGDKAIEIEEPTMTTEDFGYFVDKTKGAFYHVSANSPYPLHSDHFLVDENMITKASALHCEVLSSYLESAK